jgi:FdhE protein
MTSSLRMTRAEKQVPRLRPPDPKRVGQERRALDHPITRKTGALGTPALGMTAVSAMNSNILCYRLLPTHKEMAQSSMIQTKKPDWSKRIERAMDLAGRHPGTVEVLAFYGRVLEFQKTLYDGIAAQPAPPLRPNSRQSGASWGPPGHSSPFREQLDIDSALTGLPSLLALVQRAGPAKLAQQAAAIGQTSPEQHQQKLHDFLFAPVADEMGSDSFFARALFQPIAEYFAATPAAQLTGFAGSVCPVCGDKPQVAVLRPEGDGGKRFLVCSFCLTEWEFRRILCPICGEEDHAKLPRYAAEGVAAVRVEACDTCHYYLKGVDMTVDGLAVPLVDEIATAPLDLWAGEHGYAKISCNLMGF